jgi:DNA mismatch repair protein MutS2
MINRLTEQVLEWPQLLEALGKEADSSLGLAECLSLPYADEVGAIQVLQTETVDMLTILDGNHPFPPLVFPDIREMLIRAAKDGVLDGADLRDVSIVLDLAHTVRAVLHLHRDICPAIVTHGHNLQDLSWIRQSIDHCIDRHGEIRETASPELLELTHKSQALRQTMRKKLEQLLISMEFEEQLQGRYFAEREGRYVIPVKSERQHTVDGIVHDISASGATVFIEPKHLIELNNAIKFADLQVAQETRRILQDLSRLITESVSAIQENLQTLAHLDCLMAKAKFSQKINGVPIRLTARPVIRLVKARHPLLILTKDEVVPNSITIEGDTRMFIISGPNAGGKTVSLKMVGLFALMVKVGLLPPCSPESEIGLFHRVYADIGDTQDLSRDLSSFSGHILNLIGLLQDIGTSSQVEKKASLVLLDEVGSSTDPVEGAALAEAILCHLSQQGCTILVTTHYPSLKTLALRNLQAHNASQEFNLDTLSPTYRLLDGIPGGSSALEIAGRLGLDPAIIRHAESVIQRNDQDLQEVFLALHQSQRRLDEELARAEHFRQEAQRAYEETQAVRHELEQREREDRQRYRRQWQREFSGAQRELNRIFDELKKDKTPINVKQTQHILSGLHRHMLTQVEQSESPSLPAVQAGDWVEIVSLGTMGKLLEPAAGKKVVAVQVGGRTVKIAPSGLRPASETPSLSGPSDQKFSAGPRPAVSFESAGPERYEETVDVRGSRLWEAIERVELALDQAMARRSRNLKVIHGRGSGALQAGIRDWCRTSPYIRSFRIGDPAEGGDGVTFIELP